MRAIEIKSYTYNSDLMVRDIGAIRMVYNKSNGDMYELSEMGKEVFVFLEKATPIPDIIDTLLTIYDAEREEIEQDIEEFVIRMIELGVIMIPDADRSKIFSLTFSDTLDSSEYLDLRASVGWEAISPKQAQSSISNSYLVIGCKCNHSLIACARVMWDGGYTAFIVDVMVRPEWQNRGIGRQMMESLIERLDCQLDSGEKLMINLYSSAGKEGFYEKFGFAKGAGMVKWIRKE